MTSKSPKPLLPPNPDLPLGLPLLLGGVAVPEGPQLELPHPELIGAPVRETRVQVEGPAVLGTRQAAAQHNAEVLDIEGRGVRERVRGVRATLGFSVSFRLVFFLGLGERSSDR